MNLIHKVWDFEVGQVDEAARTFWAVASSEQVDRQGDVICAEGWDFANFLKNPVIPWCHDYASPPVARARELKVEAGRLWFLAQFPTAEEYAFADTIYRLYRGGYLTAFSVGFAPIESEVATHQVAGRVLTGTKYLKQELYEISCVTLPANPEALAALARRGLASTRFEPQPRPDSAGQTPAVQAARRVLAGQALKSLIWRRAARGLGLNEDLTPLSKEK